MTVIFFPPLAKPTISDRVRGIPDRMRLALRSDDPHLVVAREALKTMALGFFLGCTCVVGIVLFRRFDISDPISIMAAVGLTVAAVPALNVLRWHLR